MVPHGVPFLYLACRRGVVRLEEEEEKGREGHD